LVQHFLATLSLPPTEPSWQYDLDLTDPKFPKIFDEVSYFSAVYASYMK
jgi:hypothetical protein